MSRTGTSFSGCVDHHEPRSRQPLRRVPPFFLSHFI
jgi:hypothetical protein